MWVVAGLTWWPAWLLFPLFGYAAYLVMRPLLPEVRRLTVLEEMAWTDHAAVMEEGVSGRDDLRTSLGQAHVVRRVAALSGVVHRRFHDLLQLQTRITPAHRRAAPRRCSPASPWVVSPWPSTATCRSAGW